MKKLLKYILTKINICILKIMSNLNSENFKQINEESIENVVVFAPHADDESIGCGGILKKHCTEQSNVFIINMTDGRGSSSSLDSIRLGDARKKELQNIANKLGVNEVISLDFPDGNLQCGRSEVLKVKNLILQCRPNVIYTPFFCDTHRDHITTSLILSNVLKELNFNCEIRAYEVQTPMTSLIFNSFYEISHLKEFKRELLLSFKSQTLEFENIFLGWKVNGFFIKSVSHVEVFLIISSNLYIKLIEKYINNIEDIKDISEKFYSSGSTAKILLTYIKGYKIRNKIKQDINKLIK